MPTRPFWLKGGTCDSDHRGGWHEPGDHSGRSGGGAFRVPFRADPVLGGRQCSQSRCGSGHRAVLPAQDSNVGRHPTCWTLGTASSKGLVLRRQAEACLLGLRELSGPNSAQHGRFKAKQQSERAPAEATDAHTSQGAQRRACGDP